jgi:sec-independent protein translocase protein TatA
MMMFITMGAFGAWQIVVIVLLIVLLFGAKKIPELMRGAGRGVKEFKDAMNKDYTSGEEKKPEAETKSEEKKGNE